MPSRLRFRGPRQSHSIALERILWDLGGGCHRELSVRAADSRESSETRNGRNIGT